MTNHTPTSHAAQAGIDLDNEKLIAAARAEWNAGADMYNQWVDLGQDERDALIALARNAACAAPAADERALFEHAERASNLARDEACPEDYANPCVQSAWEGWQARAALAQQAASNSVEFGGISQTAPAAQAVDALGPKRWSKEAEMVESWIAASPAPETAQADDCLLCAKNGGHCWRHKQVAHAQQDAAPAGYKLVPAKITPEMIEAAMVAHYGKRRVAQVGGAAGIDMTVNDINYSGVQAMRRFWDGALSAAPSAAMGKAAAANAGGLSSNVLPEGAMFDLLQRYASAVGTHSAVETMRMAACRSDRGEFASEAQKRIEACALREQVRDAIKVLYAAIAKSMEQHSAPATSAADVKDADKVVEEAAKAIYARFDGAREHPWVERGNSDKQEEARLYARAAIAAIAASQKGTEA